MSKHKMTLSNLTGVITPPSDEISCGNPVRIRQKDHGLVSQMAGPARRSWLLEATVQWVILTREQITIYLRPKDYNTSVEVK